MKTRASFSSACVALSLVLTTASAGLASAATADGEAPPAPEAPAAVAAAAPAPPVGASVDPNIDRGFLLPTAMNQPAGSMVYNNYELLLHGFTYAISDRMQTTVTVLSPIVKDMPFFGVAAFKGQVVAIPRFYLALQGSAGYGHSFSTGGDTGGGGALLGAGAFATTCLSADCSSLLSASATYELALATGGTGSGNKAHMILYGASVVGAVSTHVKLLGEIASATVDDANGQGWDNAPGALLSYGVRFHSGSIAGDVGFVKPLVTGSGSDDFLLGLPFVNFSYRWQ
jgi:hypothetical protein